MLYHTIGVVLLILLGITDLLWLIFRKEQPKVINIPVRQLGIPKFVYVERKR